MFIRPPHSRLAFFNIIGPVVGISPWASNDGSSPASTALSGDGSSLAHIDQLDRPCVSCSDSNLPLLTITLSIARIPSSRGSRSSEIYTPSILNNAIKVVPAESARVRISASNHLAMYLANEPRASMIWLWLYVVGIVNILLAWLCRHTLAVSGDSLFWAIRSPICWW